MANTGDGSEITHIESQSQNEEKKLYSSSGQPNSSSQPPTTHRKILNGYLTFHSRTGLMKSYKPRWVVYSDKTGKLLYYKTREDLIPDGEILITHATFTFDPKEKPGVFEIRVDDQSIVLEARDHDEMLTWLQELQTRRRDITKRTRHQQTSMLETFKVESLNDETIVAEIPRIVASDGKIEKQTSAVTSRISNNVSKAADSAKQTISSISRVFNRKSQPSESSLVCTNCKKMETDMYAAVEESRIAREELSANQQVLRMLHNNMDLLQQEIHSLQSIKKIYEDPDTAAEMERQKESFKLRQIISELSKDKEKLESYNQSLKSEVTSLREQQEMLQETIAAKDSVIVTLSCEIENADSEEHQDHSLVVAESSEPFHDSLVTRLEAYELQNKFLNKEILELNVVRIEDERFFNNLHQAHLELEAKYYQLQSKYLLVLHEMNKPQINESGEVEEPDELMTKLLDEAMKVDQDSLDSHEVLTSSLRIRKYDSYGFEIEQKLDDDVTAKAADLLSKSEKLVSNMHETPEVMSLRVKWENFLTMLTSNPAKIQRSSEFKELIRAGIPQESREKVWNVLINYHVHKLRDKVGPSYYSKLLEKHKKTAYNPIAKQIEIDLPRTLPNNKYFDNMDCEGISKLRNVLLAYSYHNPSVGYCQGMNRTAAFALLFLKEEDAFWCLVAIIDFIMPKDYFGINMIAAQTDQRVLRDLLQEKLPRLVQHMNSMELDISLFSFNWFIALFIENTPIPTVLRIWDVFLSEGSKVLFRFATAFFKYAEERILRCNEYLSANAYLREFASKMTDVERVVYIAFHTINPFPLRYINSRRAYHMEIIKNELRELNALRELIRGQREPLEYVSDFDDDEDDDDS